MSHTEELLSEQKKAGGDPKAIEIELAKHHVRPAGDLRGGGFSVPAFFVLIPCIGLA